MKLPALLRGSAAGGRKPDEFKRIVVIVTRQIGDVLLTTPLIRAAKKRWPRAQIDVLGFAGTLGMLRNSPDVHGVIEVPAGATWWQSFPLIFKLWRRYDLALIAQHNDRAHLYGWMAARVRSGQVPINRRSWWKRCLLVHSVELGAGHEHVAMEKLKLMAPWVTDAPELKVVPPPGALLPADLISRLNAAYVVLQVPSLVRYKQWPIAHYAALATRLEALGHQVVLTGGPSDADRKAVAEVVSLCRGAEPLNATGRLDLNQMTTLLQGARLYIGPDTSVTHLAAASGVPTVALFGPIDPMLWGPWPAIWPVIQPYVASGGRQVRGNVILLQGNQSCVPCNREGCDRHRDSRSECLETMSPERVLAEAVLVLNEKRGPQAITSLR